MENDTARMRSFLIKFAYYALIIAIAYCAFKFVVPFFMPFVLAFLLAFLLKSPINWLSARLHLPRGAVAVLMLILFYAVAVTLAVLLGTRLAVAGADAFKALPDFYAASLEPALRRVEAALSELFSRFNPQAQGMLDTTGQSLTQALGSAVSSGSSAALAAMTGAASHVPGFFVKLLLMIVASFFFAVDYYKVASFLANLLPPQGKSMLFRIKQGGVDAVLKFARAYAVLLSITFAEVAVGLALLGVKNAPLIALVTAVVDILPVLGTGTVLIPWAAYELFAGRWFLGFGLLALYGVVTVVRQSLEPRIVGREIGLYPLATLICMFAGAQLFGFWGMFGLPIGMVIFIQLRREERAKAVAAAPDKPAPPSEKTPAARP